ncbi:MAG: SnoaL-like domain protein [Phenylobacterium sp.]|nr:SnoaL-like domain protein [Phenylobacterium sp.]
MSGYEPLTVETLLARAEVSDVVHRYATGIDRRNWELFRSCFTDRLDLDFTSWSGGEPRTVETDEWAAGVKGALSGFDATQHVSSNHVHQIAGGDATCVSYMMALHHLVDDGQRLMHAIGGFYTNRLRRGADGWKIHSCKLTVTWEMGDRQLFQVARARWDARSAAQSM